MRLGLLLASSPAVSTSPITLAAPTNADAADAKVAKVAKGKGDSRTDDTAAIQRATDTRRVLYFPTGFYVATDTLRLEPDAVLPGCTRRRRSSSSPTKVRFTPASVAWCRSSGCRAANIAWRSGADSLFNDVEIMGGGGTPTVDGKGLGERRGDAADADGAAGGAVQASWGMTELSPPGALAPLSDPSRRASPRSGSIFSSLTRRVTRFPNRAGSRRICASAVRPGGRAVFRSHRTPDAAGRFATDDLVRIDADGKIGRAKALIKSGGDWIHPVGIEAVAGADPRVALAAVIGRSDPTWGERPVLVVEPRRRMLDQGLRYVLSCVLGLRTGGCRTRVASFPTGRCKRRERSTTCTCVRAMAEDGRPDQMRRSAKRARWRGWADG